MPIVMRLTKHRRTLLNLKHHETLVKYCETLCNKHKHCETHIRQYSIWNADNPVERLNVHLSLLVERFVPTKVICVRNKDKPWFNDDCSRRPEACIQHQAGGPSPMDS